VREDWELLLPLQWPNGSHSFPSTPQFLITVEFSNVSTTQQAVLLADCEGLHVKSKHHNLHTIMPALHSLNTLSFTSPTCFAFSLVRMMGMFPGSAKDTSRWEAWGISKNR